MSLLILSEENDETINRILDYLLFFHEIDFVRLNSEDYISKLTIKLNNSFSNISIENTRGIKVDLSSISNYFHRRGNPKFQLPESFIDFKSNRYREYYENEIEKILRFIHFSIDKKISIGGINNDKQSVNLINLEFAKECGIKIPNTLITTSKNDLLEFVDKNKAIIKPIGDHYFFKTKDFNFNPKGTQEITLFDLKHMPDTIFPTLVQEKIDKEYEIRVFFIDELYYAMAILSQNNDITKLDFRNYDKERMNRFIPYTLDGNLLTMLKCFMKKSNHFTGSIDLIKSTDGEIYFLEINPSGQFSWLSDACNYNIEKDIARLIQKSIVHET